MGLGLIWNVLEVLIIFGIIYMQYKYYLNTNEKIVSMKDFFNFAKEENYSILEFEFNNKNLIPQQYINQSVITTNVKPNIFFLKIISENNLANSLIDSLNKIMLNHRKELTDLSILTPILDDYEDSVMDEINLIIQRPLYLGLIGTIIGIVFGLISFIITSSTTDNPNFLSGFLFNVAFAMIASLVGLSLTIHSSSNNFKNAVREFDKGRINLDLILVEKILPKYKKTNGKDSTSNLEKSIGNFNLSLEENISKLDKVFNSNLIKSLENQNDIVEKLNKSGINEHIPNQIKLLTKLTENFNYDSIKELSTYITNTEKLISNILETKNRQIDFLNKTEDLEILFKNLNKIMEESGEFLRFISSKSNNVNDFNTHADSILQDVKSSYNNLFDATKKNFEDVNIQIKSLLSSNEISFGQHFEDIKSSNSSFIEKVEKLNDSLFEALNKDNKLQRIDDISKNTKELNKLFTEDKRVEINIDKLSNVIKEENTKIELTNKNLLESFNNLKDEVKKINESNITNLTVFGKIEENIKTSLTHLEKISKDIASNSGASITNNFNKGFLISGVINICALVGLTYFIMNRIPDNSVLVKEEIELLKEIRDQRNITIKQESYKESDNSKKTITPPIPVKQEPNIINKQ